MAAMMLEEGIYVIGFSYPVVPKGKARIRVQISAAHSPGRYRPGDERVREGTGEVRRLTRAGLPGRQTRGVPRNRLPYLSGPATPNGNRLRLGAPTRRGRRSENAECA